MKNEFVGNDHADTAIREIYQAQYQKSDHGIKNGETQVTITCPAEITPELLKTEIEKYFNGIKANADLKKYYITIETKASELMVDFKWGHHAIIANGELAFT